MSAPSPGRTRREAPSRRLPSARGKFFSRSSSLPGQGRPPQLGTRATARSLLWCSRAHPGVIGASPMETSAACVLGIAWCRASRHGRPRDPTKGRRGTWQAREPSVRALGGRGLRRRDRLPCQHAAVHAGGVREERRTLRVPPPHCRGARRHDRPDLPGVDAREKALDRPHPRDSQGRAHAREPRRRGHQALARRGGGH